MEFLATIVVHGVHCVTKVIARFAMFRKERKVSKFKHCLSDVVPTKWRNKSFPRTKIDVVIDIAKN